MKNILVIGPHPDDIEFGCSPVLIKEIKQGNKVKALILSLGESSTSGTPTVRKGESEKAMQLVGAELSFLDMGGDCHIQYNLQNTLTIARVIREFKPDIVITTTDYENQHPDHVAVANITRDAVRFARYGGLKELETLPAHKVSTVYCYASTHIYHKIPDVVVDVSLEVDQWKEVMGCHQSQMKTKNYSELQLSRARMLGLYAGKEYCVGLFTDQSVGADTISQIGFSLNNF